MASSVATPLEKQFSTIAGIDSMTSTNSLGQSQHHHSVQSEPQYRRRRAGRAGRDRAGRRANFRRNMPTPPTFQQGEPGRSADPVSGADFANAAALATWTNTRKPLMAQRISMVNGVAQVQVYGAQKYAVRVQLDPQRAGRLARSASMKSATPSSMAMPISRPARSGAAATRFTILANGQLTECRAVRPDDRRLSQWRARSPRRLGRVIDSVQNDKSASWFNGDRAIVLAIQRQPGTNTVEVVDSIKQLLPQLEAQIPAAVQIDTLYDRSESIRDSVDDVKFTLLLTIGLVVMVIFLFLRNVSATIIPALALPMSIIGTFAVMYLLGYSLDNLSLMALTLSVGFVVDDAIVMLENIVRHMEMGKSPLRSGARRLARNRLHHSLDDALARRGVHSRAVHGRHHRTAAARICRHDWRRRFSSPALSR